MRICKSVFGIALAHPIYLGVYVVFLSLLGIFLTGGSTYVDTAGTTYVAEPANLAVVDRDGSALSQALEAYLADMHNVADVADDEFALQDALATNTVDAVVIVPEGFGSDCLASALAEQQAVQWVQLAGAAAALEPEAGVSRIAELAAAATAERADTEVIGVSSSRGPSYPLGAYLSFSTYTIVCSVVVCVGLVLTKMSEQDVRRRMLVALERRSARSMPGARAVRLGAHERGGSHLERGACQRCGRSADRARTRRDARLFPCSARACLHALSAGIS